MDFRLLVAGLLLDATTPLFFGLLWNLAVQQNAISLFNISIAIMLLFLGGGLVLVSYGLVRSGVVRDWQAGVLFLGSVTLGVLVLLFEISMAIGYGDDLAACGGFPPGVVWNPKDTILTRCDIFYRVQWYPMLQWVWTIPFATAGLAFLGSFTSARRLSLDKSTRP